MSDMNQSHTQETPPSPMLPPEPTGLPKWVWVVAVCGAGAFAFLAFLAFQRPETRKENSGKQVETAEKADPAKEARILLAQNRDIDSCRKSLQLLNQALAETNSKPGQKPALPPSLSQADTDYLLSGSFPPADAWHWAEQCFLRNIIQGNELAPPAGKQITQAHLTDIWDWSMRAVRISDLAVDAPNIRGISPLTQVIRRGTGTSEERGLVFLELIHQLRGTGNQVGPTGCMVVTQRAADDPFSLMVAWQLEPGGKIFLGDPRTGRILGKPSSPESLDELLKDPSWLQNFSSRGENIGDLKISLNGASFLVPLPLASLAPRQEKAQSLAFPPNDSPLLKRDPDTLISRLKTALASSGLSDPKVQIDPNYLTRQINYLPKADGGRDSGLAKQASELAIIPWDSLPVEFVPQAVKSIANLVSKTSTESGQIPADTEHLIRLLTLEKPERLGASIPESLNMRFTLTIFGAVFMDWQAAPNKGRDLLVRGDFNRVVPDLIQEKVDLERKITSINPQSSREALIQWLKDAGKKPAANQANSNKGNQEEIEEQMIQQNGPFLVFLSERITLSRIPEVQLALAQARHEQAAILDRKSRANRQSQQGQDRIRQWKAAALAWGTLAKDQQGKHLGAYARLWQGQASYNAGDFDSARQAWAAAGEGPFPEQVNAKWLLAGLGR